MTDLGFWKLESVGNDFVLVDERDVREASANDGGIWTELSLFACQRRFGVGSDGLLVVAPVDRGRMRLRMFNPDGTEDFCGNGLRCAARHAFDAGWVGASFVIEHLGQSVPVEVEPGGLIATTLGPATFSPAQVPLAPGLGELFRHDLAVAGERVEASSLSTGSTHTVLLVEELPDDDRFVRVSSALEVDPRFPTRTSVIWAAPSGSSELQIRIWERGAGETLGCGTGSTAAAVVWSRANGLSGTIRIENPGGRILVTLDRWDGPTLIRSSAQAVFSGRLAWPKHRSESAGTVA